MVPLNLPYYPFKLKERNLRPYIFDEIRRKYLLLTPEEWVRQHMVHYLVNHRGYPRGLIQIETGVTVNTQSRRSDLLVVDRQARPFLLVECKGPTVPLNQHGLDQAARYNTAYHAKYLALSNGLDLFVYQIEHHSKEVIQIDSIPVFEP